jgi:L-threonylcarbamoyladenylate synthase
VTEPAQTSDEVVVDRAVSGLQRGKAVVLPTDTVYGLCASPYREASARALAQLKGRRESQPIALLAADVDFLFECVPELRGRSGVITRALLPGPYTLVLRNPARRFRWLSGANPDTIGVRVPVLEGDARSIIDLVGAVAATSANVSGAPDPARLEDVPEDIRAACSAVIDGGELPGVPSTVLDFTGNDPRVVREGAAPAAEALERVAAILRDD